MDEADDGSLHNVDTWVCNLDIFLNKQWKMFSDW